MSQYAYYVFSMLHRLCETVMQCYMYLHTHDYKHISVFYWLDFKVYQVVIILGHQILILIFESYWISISLNRILHFCPHVKILTISHSFLSFYWSLLFDFLLCWWFYRLFANQLASSLFIVSSRIAESVRVFCNFLITVIMINNGLTRFK